MLESMLIMIRLTFVDSLTIVFAIRFMNKKKKYDTSVFSLKTSGAYQGNAALFNQGPLELMSYQVHSRLNSAA